VVAEPRKPLTWTLEAERAVTDARRAFDQRLRRHAETHAVNTASNLVTGDSVDRGLKQLEQHTPGPFWVYLDVVATVLIASGVNLITADTPHWLVAITLVATGVGLGFCAKVSTHAPDWRRWREKVRVRRL